MKRKKFTTVPIATFALVAMLSLVAVRQAPAQESKTSYPATMAPLDQYLMDRNAEIALARSAAPPAISKDATVMVLGRQGYETAVQGTNGFVCTVDRSWADRFENSPEFWSPKRFGPVCYNPAAAKTVLPITFIRTRLALAGKSKAEIKEGVKAAIDKGEVPALEPGGMAYMLSKQGHLNDRYGHWLPHLMFYVPLTDARSWGADAPGSPVLLNAHFNGAPEPVTEFIVPVAEWSDGTPAITDAH